MLKFLIFVGAVLAGTSGLAAHDPGLSTTQVTMGPAGLSVTVGYSPADLAPLLGVSARPAGNWTEQEFSALEPKLQRLAPQFWTLTGQRGALLPDTVRAALTAANTVSFELHFKLPAAGAIAIESGVMDRLPPGHRDFLSVADPQGGVLLERLVDVQTGRIVLRR